MEPEYYEDSQGARGQLPDNFDHFPPPMGVNEGVIQLTDPQREMDALRLNWEGKRMVDDKVILVGQPLMNQKGITAILTLLKSSVSQIAHVSNLTKNEIEQECVAVADTLIKALMGARIEYEIPPGAARDIIFQSALNYCSHSLKRAQDAGALRFMKGSSTEVYMHKAEGEKKGGLLSRALGWGKK